MTPDSRTSETRLKRLLRAIENNRILVVVIFLSTALIGLGKLSRSIVDMRAVIRSDEANSTAGDPTQEVLTWFSTVQSSGQPPHGPDQAVVRRVVRMGISAPSEIIPLLRDLMRSSEPTKAVTAAVASYWIQVAIEDREDRDLHVADLDGANLAGTDLTSLDLRWANLSRADLSHATLSGAFLAGASLFEARLRGADLTRTDLYSASLAMADLSEAILDSADLSAVDLCIAESVCNETVYEVRSLEGAFVREISTAPDGFIEWALASGATDRYPNPAIGIAIEKQLNWERMKFLEEVGGS